MTKTAPIQIDFNARALGLNIQYACTPWVEHERIFFRYARKYGNSQSAEKIADRGGFGIKEAIKLGYDNPTIIWVATEYPEKDSEWVKLALKFNLEERTVGFQILTEEQYKSLDYYEVIKDEYDR